MLGKREKLLALLGIFLFGLTNYPLLQIFNRDALWAGIPLLPLFLYGAWILGIVALYVFGRPLTARDRPPK